MNRRQTFDAIAADITKARPAFGDAVARLMETRPGMPGAQDYSGSTGGGGLGSPVERSVIGHDGNVAPNPTAQEIAELDRRLRRLAADADWINGLVARQHPQAATSKQKAVSERVNGEDTSCAHCREGNTYEPYRAITDVGGILPAPVPLCRWHTDFTNRVGRRATPRETELHHQGRTVRLPA